MLLGLRGFSVIPGITRLTPYYTGASSLPSNGVGFSGLGDASDPNAPDPSQTMLDNGAVVDPTTGQPVSTLDGIFSLIKQGAIALNAQQVFQLNLDRLKAGQPPIPAQYAAPSVNLGIAGVSMPMLLLGAGILLYFASKR